jgi:hypothetical protein
MCQFPHVADSKSARAMQKHKRNLVRQEQRGSVIHVLRMGQMVYVLDKRCCMTFLASLWPNGRGETVERVRKEQPWTWTIAVASPNMFGTAMTLSATNLPYINHIRQFPICTSCEARNCQVMGAESERMKTGKGRRHKGRKRVHSHKRAY